MNKSNQTGFLILSHISLSYYNVAYKCPWNAEINGYHGDKNEFNDKTRDVLLAFLKHWNVLNFIHDLIVNPSIHESMKIARLIVNLLSIEWWHKIDNYLDKESIQ